MPEKDIIAINKIKQDAIFDIKKLYKHIKSWYSLHKYDLEEKEYDEFEVGSKKDMVFKFASEKIIDDYTAFNINIAINISDYKQIKDPNKDLIKGRVEIGIRAMITSDFQGKWESKPWQKFMRGVYDKFIFGDKSLKKSEELKSETESLIKEIKSFLNMIKLE